MGRSLFMKSLVHSLRLLVVAGLGVIATVDYTLMLWRERVR
jgi:hypothetical protein